MQADDFARAVARHIDRRLGSLLASRLVAEQEDRLRRPVGRKHIVDAALRVMRVFAPDLRIQRNDVPHGARPIARMVVFAAFEEDPPDPGTIHRLPVAERSLALALRLFLDGLCEPMSVAVPRPTTLPEPLPPLLERQYRAALGMKPIGQA